MRKNVVEPEDHSHRVKRLCIHHDGVERVKEQAGLIIHTYARKRRVGWTKAHRTGLTAPLNKKQGLCMYKNTAPPNGRV